MSVVENLDRPTNTDLGLNARVDRWSEMSLEPLRELMADFGPDGCVDDLDEVISILIFVLNQKETKFTREYIHERMYAMHRIRMAFTS